MKIVPSNCRLSEGWKINSRMKCLCHYISHALGNAAQGYVASRKASQMGLILFNVQYNLKRY